MDRAVITVTTCYNMATHLAAVRFGPWAMAGGETPNVSPGDCAFFKQQGYNWIFDQVGCF
jgi:hypothetical protein